MTRRGSNGVSSSREIFFSPTGSELIKPLNHCCLLDPYVSRLDDDSEE